VRSNQPTCVSWGVKKATIFFVDGGGGSGGGGDGDDDDDDNNNNNRQLGGRTCVRMTRSVRARARK